MLVNRSLGPGTEEALLSFALGALESCFARTIFLSLIGAVPRDSSRASIRVERVFDSVGEAGLGSSRGADRVANREVDRTGLSGKIS